MRRKVANAVFLGLICVASGSLYAQTPPIARPPVPRVPAATIVAIRGNFVTFQNSKGDRKTVEVASVTGLRLGSSVSWCEEDCRFLTGPDLSIRVIRVLQQ